MAFDAAIAYVRSLPKDGPVQLDNATKLEFYGLFKQATEGDNTASQPWAIQVEKRAKWDAHESRKGMSADEAKRLYVEKLVEVTAKAGHPWAPPA
jgi:acyl-CoA-binding protein